LLAAIALSLPVLTYPPGRDQGWFAVFGRGILDGYKPYLDFWDTKPPAIFYTYAAAFALFGKSAIAIRLLDVIAALPIAVLLFAIARRLGEWRGVLAALGFYAFYFSDTFWTLSPADGLALLPLAISAWCTLKACDAHARSHHSTSWFLLSGIAAGCAIWFKYSLALVALAIVVVPLLACGRQRLVLLIRHGATYSLGIAIVAVVGASFLALNGVLSAAIESARVAGDYATQDYASGRWLQSTVWIAGVNERVSRWWPLLLLITLWWPLQLRLPLPLREGLGVGEIAHKILWLWLLAAALNVLVQAKGFDYHWLPMLPPLLILAADALVCGVQLLARTLHFTRIALAVIAVALVLMVGVSVTLPALPFLLGGQTRTAYDERFVAGEFSAAESAHMSEFLRQRVALGDTLFVWGSRPEIYFQAQLRPATRFISHTTLSATWTQSGWRKENVDVLWAAMPPYALVLQGDYFPWVTGNNDDSATLLQGYTELNNWLIANYERDGQIGNFLIWKRKNQ